MHTQDTSVILPIQINNMLIFRYTLSNLNTFKFSWWSHLLLFTSHYPKLYKKNFSTNCFIQNQKRIVFFQHCLIFLNCKGEMIQKVGISVILSVCLIGSFVSAIQQRQPCPHARPRSDWLRSSYHQGCVWSNVCVCVCKDWLYTNILCILYF